MAKKIRITDTDLGFNGVVRNFKKIKGSYVKVGLQGESGQKTYKDESEIVTVVDVAVRNEFGDEQFNIPERSFLRRTFDKKYREWIIMNRDLFFKIITGYFAKGYRQGVSKALDVMGLRLTDDVKKTILAGVPPPNSRRTIAIKIEKGRWNKFGSGRPILPLIDTGRMFQSITYEKVIK